jgi:uncharacterized protein YecE (DUF72 family)
VEINNTFYRMPTEPMLRRWAEMVTPDFRFVLKAPRRITHDRRLGDVADLLSHFFAVAASLENAQGPALFQLPPNFKKDVARLEDFLTRLPPGRRVAIEFRHESWLDDEVYETLRAHGAALCVADTDDGGEPALVSTAGWGYLRLRRQDYPEPELRAWGDHIRSQPWDEAFVFFKHEDEGQGPKLAARFIELNR